MLFASCMRLRIQLPGMLACLHMPYSVLHTNAAEHAVQIDPALNGTKNVLASVIKHKAGIKRVVMTSSVVGNYTLFLQHHFLVAALPSKKTCCMRKLYPAQHAFAARSVRTSGCHERFGIFEH